MSGALGVVLVGPDGQAASRQVHGLSLVERAERVLSDAGLPVVVVESLDDLTDIDDILVVHDPLQAMVTTSMVHTVVKVVSGGAVTAAVVTATGTDAVKEVNDTGVVVAEVDRSKVSTIVGPLALWADLVPVVPQAVTLSQVVQALGSRVLQVTVPGPLVRVDTADAARLAEAMLTPRTALDDVPTASRLG